MLTAVIIFLAIGVNVFKPFVSRDSVTITITDKERIVTGSGDSLSSKYLVHGENETFQNSDCWLLFKFDSSDVQRDLKVGGTYTIDVYGWRIPFLSWYRNIIEIE